MVLWVYKTTQKKRCLKFIFLLPEEKPFCVLLRADTHVECWLMTAHKIFWFVYLCVCEKKKKSFIFTASTQKYSAQTHTHTHSLNALWPFSPPYLCLSLCPSTYRECGGWGCEVVSCKAWPFLLLAHTHTHTNTQIQKSTHRVSACILPVLSQWYWGAISLSNLSRLSGTDGWQTDRVEEHQHINNASFCTLPLLCLSLAAGCWWNAY